jgi:LCP family protein required for cell wall assembly
MKLFRHISPLLIIFIFVLSACGSAPQTPAPAALPFILITSAPNPSPTPTPFQPLLNTPTQQSLLSFDNSTPLYLPTETPSPSPTPPIDATATVDLLQLFPTSAAPPDAESLAVSPTPLPPLTDNETINFLLIGSDKRPGSSYRTDTIVVAVVWPKEGQVSLISIPRDLWIYIPTVGMQRINTAYQSGEIYGYPGGGPGLLKDTISYNLGIRIDHTAMVDFDGFRRIVDTLGGVEVPIACSYTDWRLIDPSYDQYNENNWWLYTVGPGHGAQYFLLTPMTLIAAGVSRKYCAPSSGRRFKQARLARSRNSTTISPAQLLPILDLLTCSAWRRTRSTLPTQIFAATTSARPTCLHGSRPAARRYFCRMMLN